MLQCVVFESYVSVLSVLCRLYFKSSSRLETEKERLLLCYQVNEEILHARFPISYELAVELTALMAQVCLRTVNCHCPGMSQNCQLSWPRYVIELSIVMAKVCHRTVNHHGPGNASMSQNCQLLWPRYVTELSWHII